MAPKRAIMKKKKVRNAALLAFKKINLRYLYLYFSERYVAAKF